MHKCKVCIPLSLYVFYIFLCYDTSPIFIDVTTILASSYAYTKPNWAVADSFMQRNTKKTKGEKNNIFIHTIINHYIPSE